MTYRFYYSVRKIIFKKIKLNFSKFNSSSQIPFLFIPILENSFAMRKHFFLIMSLVYWLFMVVGFSDNWLYDIGQASNSVLKFMIHAFFAFAWFSLLLAQSVLISFGNLRHHKKLGIAGFVIFPAMCLSIGYIYGVRYLELGYLAPLSKMVIAQVFYAVILTTLSFIYRKKAPIKHKNYMILGSFFLIQPALDRTIGHLFDPIFLEAWLFSYLVLFGMFFWFFKKLYWPLIFGLLIWGIGFFQLWQSGEF